MNFFFFFSPLSKRFFLFFTQTSLSIKCVMVSVSGDTYYYYRPAAFTLKTRLTLKDKTLNTMYIYIRTTILYVGRK
jgi:hypothetical protein